MVELFGKEALQILSQKVANYTVRVCGVCAGMRECVRVGVRACVCMCVCHFKLYTKLGIV
jgi:hypothetical protein